ncbi:MULTISPECIES: hypothetical protein [Clostridium]|uniref:Uncharacterized protein n=1 Tax=Clostridium cibarium TaxID=2762247 RepID=A0ABR8PY82_9CLOT|nr:MULTISPECIES: hypothetical protein [Clostridium]MBD7913125.1 hypothetical protein [Clostridium cibarium]
MKKFINVMTITAASITSVLIMCTILTSYQFIYIGQLFYSYMPIQIGVATTMIFLAARFWLNENGIKKIGYTALSLSISIILLLSISIIK